MLEEIVEPGAGNTRKARNPLLSALPFYINILICAGCWKPVVEDTDDDLTHNHKESAPDTAIYREERNCNYQKDMRRFFKAGRRG